MFEVLQPVAFRRQFQLALGLAMLYVISFCLGPLPASWKSSGWVVVLAIILIWISVKDWQTFEIPDSATFCLLLLVSGGFVAQIR